MERTPHHQGTEDPGRDPEAQEGRFADLSVWLIWAVIMLLAIAALPFAVRSQDVVRAIAQMCGFDLG
jgi:hypothetical protein